MAPVPTSPGTAAPAAGSPNGLMGQLPAQPGNTQADAATGDATRLIGDMIMSLEGLSRQFPDAAPAAREAKMALVKMTQTIVSSQRGQEGPVAPAIMG